MACQGEELSLLDVLLGCPSDTEKVLVMGAIGGNGAGGYALRYWKDLKKCITGLVKSPLIGVVGNGGVNDPVEDQSTFQSDDLKGLGSTNGGIIQIVVDDVLNSNFGINSSFSFDNTTGIITWTNGNTWGSGSGLYIDLNQ